MRDSGILRTSEGSHWYWKRFQSASRKVYTQIWHV